MYWCLVRKSRNDMVKGHRLYDLPNLMHTGCVTWDAVQMAGGVHESAAPNSF